MKKILLINPLVSPDYMCEQLKLKNIYVVALYTSSLESIDEYNLAKDGGFNETLYIPIDTLIVNKYKELLNYNFDYIINGAEEYTDIFDKISSLILPHLSNSESTSLLRQDKYAMQKILADKRIDGIYTEIIDISLEFDEITDWSKVIYPVFCKPKNGYGSVNACQLNNINETKQYINDVKDEGIFSTEYLIQEYISGTEVVVDAFSVNGIHYISNIFKYEKVVVNGTPVYRSCKILQDVNLCVSLAKYAQDVLNALDVANGLTHSEIIVRDDGRFSLVEVNNRVHGARGVNLKLANYMGYETHLDLLINFVLHGSVNYEPKYLKPSVVGGIVCFAFNTKSYDYELYMNRLKELSSIKDIILVNKSNNVVSNQKISVLDLFSLVILINADRNKVLLDFNTFLELDGFLK